MCLKTKKCSIKNKKLKSVKGDILVTSSVFSLSNYNHFHNTLSLFDVFPNFSFTTRKRCRLLLINMVYINMVYISCLTSCRTTQTQDPHATAFAARRAFMPIQEKKDFGSSEILTHQESIKTQQIDSLVPSPTVKLKISLMLPKTS